MVGNSLNNMIINNSLKNWISPIVNGQNQWEANNLHIDEVATFEKITQGEWVNASLSCFDILVSKIEISKPYLIFLHFDLTNSNRKENYEIISYAFLQTNLSEYTPPSFNCTTEEYYSSFYKKEFSTCLLDKVLLDKITPGIGGTLKVFFRTFFDKSENNYSRELYIFSIK
jgi:hypothetical protein